MKPKLKKKRVIFSVGINNNMAMDNIITLCKSSNDLFDGTVDYCYFRVLEFDPDIYFDEIDEENLTENEKKEYQFLFEEYDSKYKKLFNCEFCEEMEEVITFVRKEALEDQAIKIHYSGFLPVGYSFTAQYIIKKILKYYRRK